MNSIVVIIFFIRILPTLNINDIGGLQPKLASHCLDDCCVLLSVNRTQTCGLGCCALCNMVRDGNRAAQKEDLPESFCCRLHQFFGAVVNLERVKDVAELPVAVLEVLLFPAKKSAEVKRWQRHNLGKIVLKPSMLLTSWLPIVLP